MTEIEKEAPNWSPVHKAWVRRRFGHMAELWMTCPWCAEVKWVEYHRKRVCDDCYETAERVVRRAIGAAHHAVHKAIAEGRLPSLKDGKILCADGCGRPASCYDHRDYRKPLEVDPVCRKCNSHRGHATDVAHLWVKAVPKSAPD